MTISFPGFRQSLRALMLNVCAVLLCATAQAQVYGLKQSAATLSDAVLFTITPTTPPVTGASTVTATVSVTLGGAPVSADGLAINGNNELFAYVSNNGDLTIPGDATAQLVSLNKTTGVANLIGAVVLQDVYVTGAAFDMQGRLWILTLDQMTGVARTQLRQINPADGSVIGPAITVTGAAWNDVSTVDIAFDVDNNAYLSGFRSIFSLDMATGATVAIQTLPYSLTSDGSTPNFGGMAFYRHGEVWLEQSSAVDRIVYAPAVNAPVGDFFNTILDLTAATATVNSGRMDLAARPNRVTASSDSASTPPNTPVTINVLGNDKDVWHTAGTGLSVDHSAASPVSTWGKTTASGGTVTLNATGTVTYTPAAGFIGTDTFTYRVLADDGSWAEATVTVLVGVSTAAAVPTLHEVGLLLLGLGMFGLAGLGFKGRS